MLDLLVPRLLKFTLEPSRKVYQEIFLRWEQYLNLRIRLEISISNFWSRLRYARSSLQHYQRLARTWIYLNLDRWNPVFDPLFRAIYLCRLLYSRVKHHDLLLPFALSQLCLLWPPSKPCFVQFIGQTIPLSGFPLPERRWDLLENSVFRKGNVELFEQG